MVYKIGWFSTGRDQAARDLIQTIADGISRGIIKAEIIFAFSNRERGEAKESDQFFELVEGLKIPLICFSSRDFRPEMRKKREMLKEWRRQYDREIILRIDEYTPDLIVLAGYMLIVSAELCQRYNMINLHPALPGGPAGTWQEVIWQLIESRAEETGAMIHLVTEELDKGPPIAYYSFPIKGGIFDNLWQDWERKLGEEGETNPLFAEIRHQGVIRELPLIFSTIKELAAGKIKIENGKVVAGDHLLKDGLCLNEEIEKYLKTSYQDQDV